MHAQMHAFKQDEKQQIEYNKKTSQLTFNECSDEDRKSRKYMHI